MSDNKSLPDASVELSKNIVVKIGGKQFRCECGCNVFHHPSDVDDKENTYECNACKALYYSK